MGALTVRKRHSIRKDQVTALQARLREQIGDGADLFASERVEIVETDAPFQLYVVDRKLLLFEKESWVFPTLRGAIERPFPQRRIVVDMGAVPFLVKGADVMRPGIVSLTDDVKAGCPAVVIDERHGKPLAVAIAHFDAQAMREQEKGKMGKTVHYVGDLVWNLEL
jgi:PUA domain protein